MCCVVLSCSAMSNSLRSNGPQPARLLCPWDSPGKNTGVGCYALLQGIFLTQKLNPGFPYCKEIQPVHPKGDQSWLFIGRTDVETETPILWPPDAKSWLIGKDPDAGKDWGQEEKGTTEHEMVGWHHQLNGHGFGWTLGVGDGQGGLACCSSLGRKESDMTERLNWLLILQVNSLPSESPEKPKNTGVGSLSILQRVFQTQELNPGLPHWRQILYYLSHQGSPWFFAIQNELL